MRFIEHKKLLNLIMTQNIDSLENKTNLNKENIIFAHGNFLEASCIDKKCETKCEVNSLNESIKKLEVLYCEKCKSPIKHKVVFYGESLPNNFFKGLDVSYLICSYFYVNIFIYLNIYIINCN
jgi:NAD-dependent SIR2 family protein deacetylase